MADIPRKLTPAEMDGAIELAESGDAGLLLAHIAALEAEREEIAGYSRARHAGMERLNGEVVQLRAVGAAWAGEAAAEYDRLLDFAGSLMEWMERAVNGATCAFCLPGEMTTERLATVRDHIVVCDAHPMRALLMERDATRAEVKRLRGVVSSPHLVGALAK